MTSIGFLIFCILLLVLLSAFFSSSETCMMAVNRYRLRHLAKEGSRSAARVEALLERPDRLLGVIIIGNTFANILASSLATYVAVTLFGDMGIVIATVLLTVVILIFAEVAPKTVAAMYPQPLALAYSLPLKITLNAIYPLVWSVNAVVNGLLRLMRIKINRKKVLETLELEELRTVVDESTGGVSDQSKEMLLGILDLNKITVDDVMLPRNKVIGIDINASREDILQGLIKSEHTRFPIYKGSIDEVLGILNLRDALGLISRNRFTKKNLVRAAEKPYFVPEGTPLTTQLHKFRSNGKRTALIVDEYGDIQGMVTIEDILEEIVGELDSDIAAAQEAVSLQDDGSYLVDGGVNVRELNKLMNWELPTKGAKTLSGLIVDSMQAIPRGKACLRLKNMQIDVVSYDEQRVLKAEIRKLDTKIT